MASWRHVTNTEVAVPPLATTTMLRSTTGAPPGGLSPSTQLSGANLTTFQTLLATLFLKKRILAKPTALLPTASGSHLVMSRG